MKINKNSNVYTVIYILALVLVVGVGLSLVYQALRPTQEENMANDKKRQILAAALIFPTQGESVADLYRQHIVATRVVNSRGMDATGAPDAFAVNMPEQTKLPADRRLLPVFVCRVGEQMKYIVPVYGAGLWGPIWGYIAMNADGQSIYGAYFAHQGETPGLGAKIEKPAFSDQFKGKTCQGRQERPRTRERQLRPRHQRRHHHLAGRAENARQLHAPLRRLLPQPPKPG